MGVPANFHGKKGASGRKSAYQEFARAQAASEMFFKKYDFKEIEKLMLKIKNRKGRVSVREIMMLKALQGNERIISLLADKVMATKHSHEISKSVADLLNQYNDPLSNPETTDRESSPDRGQGAPVGSVPPESNSGQVQQPENQP